MTLFQNVDVPMPTDLMAVKRDGASIRPLQKGLNLRDPFQRLTKRNNGCGAGGIGVPAVKPPFVFATVPAIHTHERRTLQQMIANKGLLAQAMLRHC